MSHSRIFGFIPNSDSKIEHIDVSIADLFLKSGLSINRKSCSENYLFIEAGRNSTSKNIKEHRFIVLIDGYITNFEEIKAKYNLACHTPHELISELLEQGVKEVERLFLGNFAISVFDKHNRELLFFRDHIGFRPIYFSEINGGLAYSSEIKYLKEIDGINLEVNKERIIHYLCQYKNDNSDTFYKNIYSAKPSFKYKYLNHRLDYSKYEHHRSYSSKAKNFDEAKKELINALTKSILDHKKYTKGKEAVLLSGGLDSSCIYKIFENELSYQDINSISKNFYGEDGDLLDCDESYYQNLIHNRSPNHYSAKLKKQSPFDKIDEYLERFDEPFNLANAYLFDEIYKSAKHERIDVLYDGIDGDTVVSHGWERLYELFQPHKLPIFFYELIRFSQQHDYSNQTKQSLFKLFLLPLVINSSIFKPIRAVKNILFPKKLQKRKQIIKESVFEQYKVVENYSFQRNFRPHKEKLDNPLIDVGFTNLNILFFDYQILQISPFFDKRVVDLCLSFPSSYKLKHGKSRYILREAFRNYLPTQILNRFKKANLTENFMKKINKYDVEKIEEEISTIHPVLKKIIDKDQLLENFAKFSSKTRDDKTNMTIWGFYLTNKWLKKSDIECKKKLHK